MTDICSISSARTAYPSGLTVRSRVLCVALRSFVTTASTGPVTGLLCYQYSDRLCNVFYLYIFVTRLSDDVCVFISCNLQSCLFLIKQTLQLIL